MEIQGFRLRTTFFFHLPSKKSTLCRASKDFVTPFTENYDEGETQRDLFSTMA